MRRLALGATLVAAMSLVAVAPADADPSEDAAAYCRTTYTTVPQQVRCVYAERAARRRLAARQAATPAETWGRCRAGSRSWVALESCLGQASARGAAAAAVPTRPISEAEAQRDLERVLDRSGATGAHCTTKPYGPGWVSVCE